MSGDQETMASKPLHRASFAETMALLPVPSDSPSSDSGSVQRLVAQQPAWYPGKGLSWAGFRTARAARGIGKGRGGNDVPAAGIHVYAQAPLAAARVVEKEERESGNGSGGRIGIHVSQAICGVYTNPGKVDRPFVYEVSKIAAGRTFSTRLVNVRQPLEPSKSPDGPFTVDEAERPQGDVCFTCLTTFKRHTDLPDDVQSETTPQERYADILSQRAPDEWPPCPQIDLDIIRSMYQDEDHGAFPMFDMYKVDMTGYNKDRPVTERREVIYYRPSHPIDADDVNAHIVSHGAQADRNGLLMLANYMGYGFSLSSVASLSYSFYVHVNPEEAVMDGQGWWIQEYEWPRTAAGRCMMETRTWSPEGKHVASGYQDGLVVPRRKNGNL